MSGPRTSWPPGTAKGSRNATPSIRRTSGGERAACARIEPIRAGVEEIGVVSRRVADFEGDDVVASIMAHVRRQARVTILSNDSDLLQLVAEDVVVASYVGVGRGPEGTRIRPWSADDVPAKYGVQPALLPAFKALSGEDGDDIPGLRNIGPGSAAKLRRRWGTLEKALEASGFVSHHDWTARLAGQHDEARLMLQLTTIRQDAPLSALALDDARMTVVRWPGGSGARAGTVVQRRAAGPGLEDVPFPE
jgi:5'-3' exonuclease